VTPNIHYKDREIEGERLELSKGALYWLGPNLTLRNCTLVISVASRWLHLLSGHLVDCTIQAKSELTSARWTRMNFKECRFKGRFSGNDFGFREESYDPWRMGGIEGCDFSEARLHGCRFFNCDMSTIQLPRWPCFTFMDPRGHATDLCRYEWPGLFGQVVIKGLAEGPEGVVAETWHAPTIAEKLDTTAEELRGLLERMPCIVM